MKIGSVTKDESRVAAEKGNKRRGQEGRHQEEEDDNGIEKGANN